MGVDSVPSRPHGCPKDASAKRDATRSLRDIQHSLPRGFSPAFFQRACVRQRRMPASTGQSGLLVLGKSGPSLGWSSRTKWTAKSTASLSPHLIGPARAADASDDLSSSRCEYPPEYSDHRVAAFEWRLELVVVANRQVHRVAVSERECLVGFGKRGSIPAPPKSELHSVRAATPRASADWPSGREACGRLGDWEAIYQGDDPANGTTLENRDGPVTAMALLGDFKDVSRSWDPLARWAGDEPDDHRVGSQDRGSRGPGPNRREERSV